MFFVVFVMFRGYQGEIKNHKQFDFKGFSLFCLNFVGKNELNEAIAHSHGTLKAEMIFFAPSTQMQASPVKGR